MAGVQEEFGNRLQEGYMANLGELLFYSFFLLLYQYFLRCPPIPLTLSTRIFHALHSCFALALTTRTSTINSIRI